jgi:hypothetical protein
MVYQLKLHHGLGVNYIVIGKKVMATEKKDRPWDGKSRPSDDNYRQRWNEIFGKIQDDELKESYEQSKRNKQEREDNEEYLKEIKNKI